MTYFWWCGGIEIYVAADRSCEIIRHKFGSGFWRDSDLSGGGGDLYIYTASVGMCG